MTLSETQIKDWMNDNIQDIIGGNFETAVSELNEIIRDQITKNTDDIFEKSVIMNLDTFNLIIGNTHKPKTDSTYK